MANFILLNSFILQFLSSLNSFTDNTTPIVTKSHPQAICDDKFVREETARPLKEGKIEPSKSQWWAQAFVTSKENHKKEW